MKISPYRWETIYDGLVVVANALSAEVVMVCYAGIWFCYGSLAGERSVKLLSRTHCKITALARGDDFLRTYGEKDGARKSKRWLNERPSDKQIELIGQAGWTMNRYQASCHLTWKFKEEKVKKSIMSLVS